MATDSANAQRRRACLVFFDETALSLTPNVCRSWAPRGRPLTLTHPFNWKKASMAAALCYGVRGGGAQLAFHVRAGNDDTDSLIDVLGELRRFLGGEKATLVWDGLPAHPSRALRAWLNGQRSWLVVEPLPAYAPELNPVEGLWSSLKAVELANLTLPILAAVIDQAHRGIDRVRRTRTWPTRSCGTPACRSRDRGQPLPNSSAMVEESSPPRCDPRCMRHQPPQRRYWRWFCLLVVLGMLIAVPLVLAAHHRQQGVEGQCAVHVAGDKPELAGYHWSWWWLPGWVCEFERDGRRWERRLW